MLKTPFHKKVEATLKITGKGEADGFRSNKN